MVHSSTTEQPRCADLVSGAADSRLTTLAAMLNPSAGDLKFEPTKAGGLTVTICEGYAVADLTLSEYADLAEALEDGGEALNSTDPEEWDCHCREAISELIWDDYEDQARESAREAFAEYGLAFDYVAPGTFSDQTEGYWRYQISYGNPSEEIRFFATQGPDGYTLHRAEFWYLHWGDGAHLIVTDDDTVSDIWDEFNECETVAHVLAQALEE